MSYQITDSTECYAVPGSGSIIDTIAPETGLTHHYGKSEADVLAQEPAAVKMTVGEWMAAKAARQDTAIAWLVTTRERYTQMLEVLPPAFWRFGLFLVGEPMDHSVTTGQPRFSGFWERKGKYFEASRPITIAEARAMLNQFGTV